MTPQFRSIGAFVVMLLLLGAILPAAAASSQPAAGSEKININTASADDLASLPGIGPSYAQRIVEYREKNGPFHKVEDLLNVRGIGEKTFERIRDRLTLGAK
jgi:competence protein ComEA